MTGGHLILADMDLDLAVAGLVTTKPVTWSQLPINTPCALAYWMQYGPSIPTNNTSVEFQKYRNVEL